MKTLATLYRILLRLRYRIHIKGEELVSEKKATIFLPNHQAHVDAQILISYLLKRTSFVPLASARFFKIPILKTIFKKLKAVPVSNLQSGKVEKDMVDTMVQKASEVLNNGSNLVIYPSGQLAGQGFEKIFNKSGTYTIVQKIPTDVRVIGVRIQGLWGSMWSKAWNGQNPPIVKNLVKGFFIILANLLFFVPKRKVSIEFVDITTLVKEKALLSKKEFNDYLEAFYNQDTIEEVNYRKHYFYLPASKRSLPDKIAGSLKELESQPSSIREKDIPVEIQEAVCSIISTEAKIEHTKIHLKSNLALELGIDSLVMVYIMTALESKFTFTFSGDFATLKTVADLCLAAMGSPVAEDVLKPSLLLSNLKKAERKTVNPDKNVLTNFIEVYKHNKKDFLAYDKTMGTSSRKDFLLKAIVVSQIIKKHVNEKHVGIMLPALQSTTLLILSTYFAGKIPVMINWTVGKKMLTSSVESMGLKNIITATAFYDKVKDQLPEEINNCFLFFDKEIKKVKLTTKLSSLFKSFFPGMIYGKRKLDETAVILFTSGSEAKPKAVPLTHQNIMFNLWSVLQRIEITSHDILLSFLPPFHSFGFTVLSILPVVSGIKVAYTPDPKDAREIIKILGHTKASILLATPTFLKIIMSGASEKDFESVKMAITGAESLHAEIASEFKRKTGNASLILQGYGITECSPILCITPPSLENLKSVGNFIPGIDYRILSLENDKPLGDMQEGMIVVSGTSVFNGYLDKNIESPFIEINGKQFYKTGDLGYIDENNNLFITGRLKRFIKIAGEMISLPALESALLEKFGETDELVLAVEGIENEDKPKIVLFTTREFSLTVVNDYLKSQGFSNLMKINQIQKMKEIPILGTGKTDYKTLKQLTKELSFA